VPGSTSGEHVHTPENIRQGVENSLRLLQTDFLDLVQFHRSLTKREFEDSGALAEALKLKAEGKVRFIGVSGTLPQLPEQVAMGVFDAFQIPYSALQSEHEAVITEASAAGAGIIIRGGVARGSVTDWDHRTYYMVTAGELKRRWEAARLDDLLDGMSRIEFMLRFTLSLPELDTTIVGTRDVGHLLANIETAAKGPLPADVLTEARHRLAL
jgi:aryl-alcohol dehydrogenase-like predicted oxidoreductase